MGGQNAPAGTFEMIYEAWKHGPVEFRNHNVQNGGFAILKTTSLAWAWYYYDQLHVQGIYTGKRKGPCEDCFLFIKVAYHFHCFVCHRFLCSYNAYQEARGSRALTVAPRPGQPELMALQALLQQATQEGQQDKLRSTVAAAQPSSETPAAGKPGVSVPPPGEPVGQAPPVHGVTFKIPMQSVGKEDDAESNYLITAAREEADAAKDRYIVSSFLPQFHCLHFHNSGPS